jgi:hypothetical protein
MSDPRWLQIEPQIFLILGITSIFAAAVLTRVGKVWVRFGGCVYRAKEPGWFWWKTRGKSTSAGTG